MALWRKPRVWIIDHSPQALDQKESFPGIRVLADGPQFLTKYQDWIKDEDWIIPALPIHLAWKWLDLNLSATLRTEVVSPPRELGSGLSYCEFLGKGLFVSYASFVCPENCPSPVGRCFKTKEKRALSLWEFLMDRRGHYGTLEVIESRQLGPGVGGFPFKELRRIKTEALRGHPPFFVATACRCHGVIHGLTW